MTSPRGCSLNVFLVLLGGFATHMYLGCCYIWGNISLYVISYFYHFGGADGSGQTELSTKNAEIVFALCMTMNAVWCPVGAFLYKFMQARILVGIGISFGVLAFLLASKVGVYS